MSVELGMRSAEQEGTESVVKTGDEAEGLPPARRPKGRGRMGRSLGGKYDVAGIPIGGR